MRPEIQAKAHELIAQAIQDRREDWTHVSAAKIEMIVQAVASDLQEDADQADATEATKAARRTFTP